MELLKLNITRWQHSVHENKLSMFQSGWSAATTSAEFILAKGFTLGK